MEDIVEDFVRELVDRICVGRPLDMGVVEESYFSVKRRAGFSESDAQSKNWCQFIYQRLSRVDLSARNISLTTKDALVRELYALISK